LIEHYRNSAHLGAILQQSRPIDAITRLGLTAHHGPGPLYGSNQPLNVLDHEFRLECLDTEIREGLKQALNQALSYTDSRWSTVTLERKARIAQMIMQCSSSNFPDLAHGVTTFTPAAQAITRTISIVMDEISQSKDAFRLPAFCQRRLFIELAVLFQRQLDRERVISNEDRKRRKRARCIDDSTESLQRGRSIPNKVLDIIIAEIPGKDKVSQKQLRARLRERIDIGHTLSTMVLQLGLGVLFALPATTVYASELTLSFNCHHASLSQALEPRESVDQGSRIYYR
jgi:hypothetical protein